ncbi:hypothetical protein ACJX0J_024656, partial [Zea mays]
LDVNFVVVDVQKINLCVHRQNMAASESFFVLRWQQEIHWYIWTQLEIFPILSNIYNLLFFPSYGRAGEIEGFFAYKLQSEWDKGWCFLPEKQGNLDDFQIQRGHVFWFHALRDLHMFLLHRVPNALNKPNISFITLINRILFSHYNSIDSNITLRAQRVQRHTCLVAGNPRNRLILFLYGFNP